MIEKSQIVMQIYVYTRYWYTIADIQTENLGVHVYTDSGSYHRNTLDKN